MAERTKVPTALPVNGRITSGVGVRVKPNARASSHHEGTDIAVPKGTNVSSTISGTVTDVGYRGAYGLVVEITAADGTSTKVAHLSQYSVKKGDHVVAGQIIARSGNTGNTTGPHVHYELRDSNHNLINPLTGQVVEGSTSNVQKSAAVTAASSIGPVTDVGSTAVDGPVFSINNQNRLREELDRDEGYYPNYLNYYNNVTYHVKLFMVSPDTFQRGLGKMGEVTAEEVATSLDSAEKVVIAESGITAGLTIREFSFDAFKRSAASGDAGSMNVTIVEPLGTSFYDVVTNGAIKLGIDNFKDTPYFLEVWFSGYDEDGNAIDNILVNSPSDDSGSPCPAMLNQGRWFWQILIESVDTSVTAAGAQHVIKFNTNIATGQAGQDGSFVPEALTLTGTTIGQMLDSLKEELEKSQARRYVQPDGSSLFTYEFPISDSTISSLGSNPRDWSLADEPTIYQKNTGRDMSNGAYLFQAAPGRSIPDIIQTLFANTKEAQALLLGKGLVPNRSSTESEGGPSDDQNLVKVVSQNVQYTGGNDPVWNHYKKTFIYTIGSEYHTIGIKDQRQIDKAMKVENQKGMVERLRAKGMFRKRYDYLYTGTNTEVTNFDVSFKMYWGAMLPNVIGYNVNNSSVLTAGMNNDDAVNDVAHWKSNLADAQTAARTALNQLAQVYNDATGGKQVRKEVEAGLTNKNDLSVTINDATKRANVAKAQAVYDAAHAREVVATSEFRSHTRSFYAEQSKNPRDPVDGKTFYAEELTENVDVPLNLRITQAIANTGDAAGTGMEQPYHRDRSIFGALMEQLVGEAAALMDITIDIRGDPYWLGTSNIEKEPDSADATAAPYSSGGLVFFLKVAYPFDGTIDEAGNLSLRNFNDPADDGSSVRKDQFSGYYQVIQVTNTFSEGTFKQTIKAIRHTLLTTAQDLGFNSAEGEFDAGKVRQLYQGSESDASSGGGGQGSTDVQPDQPISKNAKATQQIIYDRLKDLGYSDEGAFVMIAEIGRENSYNPDTMFGTHKDKNPNAGTNAGIVSWNKTRRADFNKFMSDRQLLKPDGTLVQSDDSLRAQVDFINKELSSPAYAGVGAAMKQPNATYASLEPLLSNRYFVWDTDGKYLGAKGVATARSRMAGYYNSAKSQIKRK